MQSEVLYPVNYTQFHWRHGANLTHSFNVYKIGEKLAPNPGLFIFTSLKTNRWIPHYVGVTDELSSISQSEAEFFQKVLDKKATHLHASTVFDDYKRHLVYTGLIAFLEPILNS